MTIPAALTTFENSISNAIDSIVAAQASYIESHAKYQQIKADSSPVNGLTVTEYVGDLGAGFVIELEKEIAGQLWRKWIDYGQEGRSQEWFMVEVL